MILENDCNTGEISRGWGTVAKEIMIVMAYSHPKKKSTILVEIYSEDVKPLTIKLF